ncbi:hypothetical protein PVAND_001335 [Polypedilum vanderplanki]|uniref:Uncharacterized protein n=1 Tax=Polypedilum vanderplanki TaxID=319348 RepID=A0A9J6BML9_POLVA|nr:hypothetical protein PVAND_001335 [Polypedilum vanderplanki]
MSSSNQVKSRRRTFSEDSSKLKIDKIDCGGILKKSLSSTLNQNIISKNDLVNESYDSLEDLNKEIEKLALYNNAMTMSSRFYCDIFSRQSIGSSPSEIDLDDERQINFLSTIPDDNGCDIIQLIPKKPTATTVNPNTIYQPCTNIQKIFKSSCSAFRDISEIKIIKSETDRELESGNDNVEEKKEITAAVDIATGDDDKSSSSQVQ